ncbi:Intradiol ring-cleavage dioxygenase [Mucidula mucida]|nr:Intradiol ring-cleavage dioxygenase [Mucidula mucida]
MIFVTPLVTAAISFAGLVVAHPTPQPGTLEFAKRAQFQATARRSLAGCQGELSKRGGVYERSKARREAFAHEARRKRELRLNAPFKRSLEDVLNTDHQSNLTGVTNNTDADTLFAGNSSCVLGPETTEGPYYVDGEFVRWDIRDEQAGIPIYVDVQLIDTPASPSPTFSWTSGIVCNATGVYAGVIASGNGDSSDMTNLDNTFLRGLQSTDNDGVAQFLSIFPGHYTGRTTHIHIAAHQNGTLFDNNTFVSDTVSHVGQLFFDQSLISLAEATEPYTSNTQELTTNAEDGIMSGEAAEIDPVLEYVYLGDDISDGLMMWSSVGIDTSSSYAISAASTLTEDGGVANEGAGGGMGGGEMPSGAPSGSMGPAPSAI